MKKIIWLFSAFILLGMGFAGCNGGFKNACEQAESILAACDEVSDHLLEDLSESSSCEGLSLCLGQCIVDFPDQACELVSDSDAAEELEDCLDDCEHND